MKKGMLDWTIIVRLCIVVLLCAASITPAFADDDDAYVAEQVVVKLFDSATLSAVAQQYGLDPQPLNQFGTRPIYLLRIVDGGAPPTKAETLMVDPQRRVLYAEPNYLDQTPEGKQRSGWARGGDAGGYAAQWVPAKINLPAAHGRTRGAGVTVAVLDTGVDLSHPALQSHLVPGYDFVNDDTDPREEGAHGHDHGYGHGTHTAGLIALAAPDAKIMPVRVLDRNGMGNGWVLAEAMEYAAQHGADVINISLSALRPNDLLEDAIEAVTCQEAIEDSDDDDDMCFSPNRRGAVVVAAAGNSGRTQEEYPAAEDEDGLLAVAASTQQDTLTAFSTRGLWVDVSAPGEQIVSTVPGGGYGTWSGTSMAAPLTAGTAALVRAANPDLHAIEVARHVVTAAQPIGTGVPPRIDAAAALGVQASLDYRLALPLVCR